MARKAQRSNQTELTTAPVTTALYVRVSTEKQADEGYSLDAQRERLQAHCVGQGWIVDPTHIYIDAGISGKSTDRPEFQRMLTAARAGEVGRIVAMKLDRLARNVRDFLALADELRGVGCELVMIKESFDTGTPQGKFALTMFAAMAELEAATIKERMLSGKAQKAAEGGWNGAPVPMGYTYSAGTWGIDEDGAAVVRIVFDLFNAGATLRAIARTLSTPERTWHPAQVGYILRNGHYAGLIQWDGVEAQGIQPALVPLPDYEVAQMRLAGLRRGRPAH